MNGTTNHDSQRGAPSTTEREATPSATDDDELSGEGQVTRRTFLRATGGAAAAAGAATAASGEGAAQTETYRFGGHVPGWEARAPESIAGETNPTLELEAGTEYEVVWENLDGVIHNFVVRTEDGEELASTEDVTQEGATASVTFTATPAMAEYICIYHQSTMVGDIEVEGEAGAGAGARADADEAADGAVPLEILAVAGSVLVLFLSPLLFALFLLTRRQRDGQEGGAPN
ncbi:cupredoxin domain-containing protein [Halorussus marinus]|uniref:cupredoxin domain-containing protein n=1 Tax=Halorussus marinus TaxID=2505976 RepID=UPI0010932BE4|nr:plastocyanin/azurin family copper-binding protein [Halorussus marinus]